VNRPLCGDLIVLVCLRVECSMGRPLRRRGHCAGRYLEGVHFLIISANSRGSVYKHCVIIFLIHKTSNCVRQRFGESHFVSYNAIIRQGFMA
jgi:hypothetical protein